MVSCDASIIIQKAMDLGKPASVTASQRGINKLSRSSSPNHRPEELVACPSGNAINRRSTGLALIDCPIDETQTPQGLKVWSLDPLSSSRSRYSVSEPQESPLVPGGNTRRHALGPAVWIGTRGMIHDASRYRFRHITHNLWEGLPSSVR